MSIGQFQLFPSYILKGKGKTSEKYLKSLLKFWTFQKSVLQDILLNSSLFNGVWWIILNKNSQYINLRTVKWMHISRLQKISGDAKSMHLWSIYYDKMKSETFIFHWNDNPHFLKLNYPLYLQPMVS